MKQGKIPFTKEGLAKIKTEYELLLLSRPEAVSHLKKARELGDLKENGYYKASRTKLSDIDRRLRIAKGLLDKGYVMKVERNDKIALGHKVTLNNYKSLIKYTLVSKYEADPVSGKISNESPLGQALIGKKKNDLVEIDAPLGKFSYLVVNITS